MNPLLESWTGLSLQDPELLALLLLLPLGLWLRRRRGRPAVVFAPAALLGRGPLPAGSSPGTVPPPLPRSWRTRLLALPTVLQTLGVALLAVALSRPVHRVQLPLQTEGIDIMLCLDVSSSMAANDMDPRRTRLDLAVAAATRFVRGRPSDRIGLIRFARYPDVRSPLTLDHDALIRILGELEQVEADGPEDLTGIGTAVARAAQVLRGSMARSKVVILLTDGEENVATAETPDEIGPARAALLCERLGVRVYTIAAGIGKRARTGEWVPLDTTQMEDLASTTGGRFFEARDAGAIASVYTTIDRLEKVEFETPRYELRERFLPFLAAAMALFAFGAMLRWLGLEVLP